MKKLEFKSVLREPGEYDCYINDGINNIFIERYDLNSLNDYRDFIIVCENEFDYIDEEDKSNINKCKEFICDKYYIFKNQNARTKKIDDAEEKRKLFKWATDYYNRMGYRLSLKREYPGDEPKYIDQNSKKDFDFKYSDYLVITGTDNIKKELSFKNIQKLYKDSIDAISETSFEKQIDMFTNHIKSGGKWEDYEKDLFYLCKTPNVLKKIGVKADVLTLQVSKLAKILSDKTHGGHADEFIDPITKKIDYDIIKQIPKGIEDPVAILKSKPVEATAADGSTYLDQRTNSFVLILDLNNKYKQKIIVPITITNGEVGFSIDDSTILNQSNILSFYGNNNWANGRKKDRDSGFILMKEQANNLMVNAAYTNGIVYLCSDKKRLKEFEKLDSKLKNEIKSRAQMVIT